MKDVRLPDGTLVRASSIHDRRRNDPSRDFGLYLDPAWAPDWPAAIVEWPDFGIPASPTEAFDQIQTALERARAGERVEIGCLGGLGRTGTVLACMAVMCGLGSSAAIDWARADYDPRAIETPEQERWVSWFALQLEGNARQT